jgi:hypothetical protein
MMARTKKEPTHNPEKFRRHLSQALFHLGLAKDQAMLLEADGRMTELLIQSGLCNAGDALANVANLSLELNPAKGIAAGYEETED